MQSRSFRPTLEALEERWVPSTVTIDLLRQNGTASTPHQIYIQGRIADIAQNDNNGILSGRTITITGIASGSCTTGTGGVWGSSIFVASSLGDIHAKYNGLDASPMVSATLTNSAPIITNFDWTNMGFGSIKFSGFVTDNWAPGLTVTLSCDIAAINGRTAVVQSDGSWSVTVNNLNGSYASFIYANVTDWWGTAAAEVNVWFNKS